ncbi:MAG: uL29 family ribosomal protein [bacterium]|nr:uL29 family ribosomal protein [bacterium]
MTKKREDMKDKTTNELATFIADTRAVLRTERFAAEGARPKDPNAPKKLRKLIARAKTEARVRLAGPTPSTSSGQASSPQASSRQVAAS